MLQDVLAAAGSDVGSAAWILSELCAPNTNPSTPNASPIMSPNTSPQRRLGAPQATVPSTQGRNHSTPPGLKSPRDTTPAHVGPVSGEKNLTPREGSGGTATMQRGHVASSPSVPVYPEDDKQEDAYFSFRADALQLTRRWQKAAQKAGSSFSGQTCYHAFHGNTCLL